MKQLLLLITFSLIFNTSYSQWTVENPGVTDDLYSVDYYSANNIWIGSYDQFIKTTNGGTSWTTVFPLRDASNVIIGTANIYDIALTSPTSGIATGLFYLGNTEYILNTTNSGTNWNYRSTTF